MIKPYENPKYSYGFGRVEVLSGYVNSMFLMVIGLMLVKEAIYRLVSPPEVHTHHLLSVSVVGLIGKCLKILRVDYPAGLRSKMS